MLFTVILYLELAEFIKPISSYLLFDSLNNGKPNEYSAGITTTL